MRTSDYSFKYVCVVCWLKIRFYCLTFSAMSNLNSADFTAPNQSSEILILKIEMLLEFQNMTNINNWVLINAFCICLRIVKYRFVKYRCFSYTFRFVRYSILSKYFVCLHNVFQTSSRHIFKASSRHVFKTSSRHVFNNSWKHLQGNIFLSSKTSSRLLVRRKIVTLKTCWRRFQDMSWRRLQDQQMFVGKRLRHRFFLVNFAKRIFARKLHWRYSTGL